MYIKCIYRLSSKTLSTLDYAKKTTFIYHAAAA